MSFVKDQTTILNHYLNSLTGYCAMQDRILINVSWTENFNRTWIISRNCASLSSLSGNTGISNAHKLKDEKEQCKLL